MIETAALLLRPFATSDASDLYEYLRSPTQSCFFDMRLASADEAIAAARERAEDENCFAIVLKSSGKVIGEIFAHPERTSPSDTAASDTWSPCWMLNPDYRGMGFGYEAARAYIDYLFTQRNTRRVYMYTEDTNLACRRLCEKLQARLEGVFMEYVSFYNDSDGKPVYENTCQYAILKKEWHPL